MIRVKSSSHSAAAYDAAQSDPRRPKRKNKPGAGRPKEGRVILFARVLPDTLAKIEAQMGGKMDTLGKVVDAQF